MSRIVGIIPARFASTRFPGKMLASIAGKSMLQRVWERCTLAGLDEVVVATDHQDIADHAHNFGAKVLMTSPNHPSGTDRCAEALILLPELYDYVINIQGDEPFIDPIQIKALAGVLDGNTEIATLIKVADSLEEIQNSDRVKVVLSKTKEALYFSRSPIPYIRNLPYEDWLKHSFYLHIGMYAYRSDILKNIAELKPGTLEMIESLEQLRWLENGFKIKTVISDSDSICVDRPQDLVKAEAYALKWSL